MNTYGYVSGNPVMAIDPLGLFGSSCGPGHMNCAAIAEEAGWTTQQIINQGVRQGVRQGAKAIADEATDKEDCRCIHYNLIYEENEKKHKIKRTIQNGETVARRPTNGQLALNMSFEVDGSLRVGHDPIRGELVILRRHRTDDQNCVKYFHGYVADYLSDLDGRQKIINTIKENNLQMPPKK